MRSFFLGLVNRYLGTFAMMSSEPARARRELRLVSGSLEYVFDSYRVEGKTAYRSALLAFWDHIGELQPAAVYRTTRSSAGRPAPVGRARLLMRLPIVLVALLLFAALSLLTLAFALTVIVWPDAAGRRAVVVSFMQQWKRTFTPGDMFFPILSATGPALAVGWVVGNSDNAIAVSYVFVGASLMAVWTLSVFYTGWSLADEHAQGTLDLLITTRTPLVLIMFGKALGIAAWMLPSAVTSFLIVLAFSNRVTPVEEPVLLLVSGLLALASVIAFSFIFAPIGFLMGARGGFFNALMPLGTVLSGFLYPIDILPAGLELAARLLPAAWAMDAVVRSVNGTGETWRVVVDWAVASGLIAVLAILSVAAFQAAEKRVRVAGSLGTI